MSVWFVKKKYQFFQFDLKHWLRINATVCTIVNEVQLSHLSPILSCVLQLEPVLWAAEPGSAVTRMDLSAVSVQSHSMAQPVHLVGHCVVLVYQIHLLFYDAN